MRSRQPSQQTELTSPGALAAPPGVPTPWHPVQLGASREDLLAALARSDSRILSFESVPPDRPKIVTSNDTMSLDFRSVWTGRTGIRSALGPQPNGKPRTTADKSGHRTFVKPAGRSVYSLLTWGGGGQAAWSSSLPTRPPRALRVLATRRWSPKTGLTLRVS
jgi:hypothetical protein